MKNLIALFLLFINQPVNSQTITTFAGGGSLTVDGIPATASRIINPGQTIFDKSENFYLPQGQGYRVSKIDTFGIITTIAGTGVLGSSGDGGQATNALFNIPNTVAIDTDGNIYISDAQNCKIRKINRVTGILTTFAGTGAPGGFSGDGGPATAAKLFYPSGICFDKRGNLFIGDGHRIRKVDINGIITTYAGNGIAGVSGDGGPATAAKSGSGVVCVDDIGNLYIADCGVGESRIAKVDTSGIITTFAGTSSNYVYNGENILATTANINPVGMAFDEAGNLFFADWYNQRVRKIDKFGIVTTIAGNGVQGFSGDGGLAINASLYMPQGIAVDKCDNIYISDNGNARIRKVTFNPEPCPHLGVNDQIIQPSISIYPNPANDVLYLDNLKSKTNYKLTSIIGKSTQKGILKQGNNTISLKSLSPGMYLLELTNEDGERTVTKIIKQ